MSFEKDVSNHKIKKRLGSILLKKQIWKVKKLKIL